MSVAWKGPVVLWREPLGSVGSRLLRRAVLPVAAALAWMLDLAPWACWVLTIAALPSALLFLFTLANLAINRRVLLVHQASGAIEWPRSVQERLLRRDAEWVAGREVAVLAEPLTMGDTRNGPRVTLSADEHQILRLPLHGTSADEFIATVNGRLEGRDVRLVKVEPETHEVEMIEPDDTADTDDSDGSEA